MSKHIVFVALEVDEKYSASDVKKEIAYGAECFCSELFDTVTGIYTPLNPIKTYQVWSSDHVAMISNVSVETHAELVALEAVTGYSYSSFVTTDDIESFVNAVINEFNGDLEYQLI